MRCRKEEAELKQQMKLTQVVHRESSIRQSMNELMKVAVDGASEA